MSSDSVPDNSHFESPTPGQADYWQKMAAPRARVAMITRLLQHWNPDQIVDLGCGGGNLLVEVQQQQLSARLFGLDLATAQIEYNRSVLPGINWSVADLTDPDSVTDELVGRFAAVVSSEVIEHVADPIALLETAHRVAAPGGRLVLSTQSGKVHETQRLVGHVRHFSVEEIDDLLRRTGWRPERVWNCGFPFHPLVKYLANLNPTRTIAAYGTEAYPPRKRLVCWATRVAYRFNSSSRGTQLYAIATRE